MFLTDTLNEMTYSGFGTNALLALIGYALVFVGLIALMFLVILVGKFFVAAEKKNTAAPIVPPAPVAPATAPGSAGQFKLNGVDPKTAAMAMAIVADTMGKPINELRFISIREVSK